MNKSLQTISKSALIFSLFLINLAATTSVSHAQITTAIDPKGTITTTTIDTSDTATTTTDAPTTDPLAPMDPVLFDPSLLQNATSVVTPTTTTNTAPTDTATTSPIDTTTSVPEVKIPPATAPTPPRTISPTISVPPSAPTNEPPAEICPPTPLAPIENTTCPKAEIVPIIPQFPTAIMVAPVLGVLLFWIIVSYLNYGQIRTEKSFAAKRLANAHRQNVDQTRGEEYRSLLTFLAEELSSPGALNQDKYKIISAKIQLIGSPEMQNLVERVDRLVFKNDKKSLKPLMKELGQQIKKEL